MLEIIKKIAVMLLVSHSALADTIITTTKTSKPETAATYVSQDSCVRAGDTWVDGACWTVIKPGASEALTLTATKATAKPELAATYLSQDACSSGGGTWRDGACWTIVTPVSDNVSPATTITTTTTPTATKITSTTHSELAATYLSQNACSSGGGTWKDGACWTIVTPVSVSDTSMTSAPTTAAPTTKSKVSPQPAATYVNEITCKRTGNTWKDGACWTIVKPVTEYKTEGSCVQAGNQWNRSTQACTAQ